MYRTVILPHDKNFTGVGRWPVGKVRRRQAKHHVYEYNVLQGDNRIQRRGIHVGYTHAGTLATSLKAVGEDLRTKGMHSSVCPPWSRKTPMPRALIVIMGLTLSSMYINSAGALGKPLDAADGFSGWHPGRGQQPIVPDALMRFAHARDPLKESSSAGGAQNSALEEGRDGDVASQGERNAAESVLASGSSQDELPTAGAMTPPPPGPRTAPLAGMSFKEIRRAEQELGGIFSGVLSSVITNIMTTNPQLVRKAKQRRGGL